MKPALRKKLDAIITKDPEGSTRFIDMWKCHKEIIESIPNHEDFLEKEIECVAKRYKEHQAELATTIYNSFLQGYSTRENDTLKEAWERSTAKETYDKITEKQQFYVHEPQTDVE